MTRSWFVVAVGLLGLAVLPAAAWAQPAAARGAGQGGVIARSMLVRQETVQKELGITAEQKAKLDAALPAARGGGGANVREMSEEERRTWREERRARVAEDDGKLGSILDAKQAARLEQIRVQALGGGVLMDPAIAKTLGVTEDQREKFRTAMQRLRDEADGDAPAGGMRERMTATVMEILTSDQRSKLDGLRGPAFDVKSLQLRGRRGERGG
jgi:Spy/CpxP family protein refolding chaperone